MDPAQKAGFFIYNIRMKIIYDLGANNGDDIPYYLTKADKVVAVEANPRLVAQIQQRFFKDIQSGQLVVEGYAVTVCRKPTIDFYVCDDDVKSKTIEPDEEIDRYKKITVPTINILDLIKKHGNPFYIKIDIEFYDHILLRCLLENQINPAYISVESHTIEVFCLLVALGKYNKFKLVEGNTVNQVYPEFPHHAAGPFGEDIKEKWLDKDKFFNVLADHKMGWKDIHATYL